MKNDGETMNRPIDIYGIEIVMGPWYWALDRRNKVRGAGKFGTPIGSTELLFTLNEVSYSPASFLAFVPAEDPEKLFGVEK